MAYIEIIATTISGSIADWSKVKRIVPLFHEHGFTDVNLVEVSVIRRQGMPPVRRLKIHADTPFPLEVPEHSVLCWRVVYIQDPLSDIRLGFLAKVQRI